MKSFIFSTSIGLVFACSSLYSACAKADQPGAPVLTKAEISYCSQWADARYTGKRNPKNNGPDFESAEYNDAEESCELQWKMVAMQWDDPENLDRVAIIAMAAGTAEGMGYFEAQALAKKYRTGVERVGPDLWAPIGR